MNHVRKHEMDKQKGGWDAYCTNELGISRKHANRFIRVYERFGNETPVSHVLTTSSLSLLDALVEFDDEELEKPRELPDGSIKKLTEMSRREIEGYKKKLKEEAEYRKLVEEENSSLQQKLKQAESKPEVIEKVVHVEKEVDKRKSFQPLYQ